jgi:hypothetical protein
VLTPGRGGGGSAPSRIAVRAFTDAGLPVAEIVAADTIVVAHLDSLTN